MNLISIITLLGGLGLFLYGMTTMGNALEKLAGEKLERTLEVMTNNIFKAILVGTVVTGIIQSSSATTVMVVGFVNAGIMSLQQAVGVIMGANIGTTVTAQILRLDTTGAVSGSLVMQLLNPSTLSYIVVAVGVVMMMVSKRKKVITAGEMLLGLGVLFIGMSVMESSVTALRDSPWFAQLFASLQNPVLGILAGTLVTAIIQSSSASVGILQAVASTGAVTYAAAIPIILGQNIGTCVTALLSSLSGNRNAKRAAMIHFYFNLIGSLVFIVLVYLFRPMFGELWYSAIDKAAIANFHTMFNIVVTLFFIPFNKLLIVLAEKTIRSAGPVVGEDLDLLDERFYSSPAVALEQCDKVINSMGVYALINIQMVCGGILDKKSFPIENFSDNEEYIDRCEARLNNYMIGIKQDELSEQGRRSYAEMMHAIGDFERLGDYAQNLLDQYQLMTEKQLTFSADAQAELDIMRRATEEIVGLTNDAYAASDGEAAPRIEALEDVIDSLKETLKNKHISRLQNGQCTVTTGVPFLDIIHNFEKISDHCANIAIYVTMYNDANSTFDIHEYRKVLSQVGGEQFAHWQKHYEDLYLAPLM
ncbi:MAG TPA: Na/Pi cotransporter family protein [Candidatus Ventrousia excrementavium]|uniref:Na/Pi cotransporter family protein n=1 Tax=Candidatus Ventrousia excrementavium TaxID=2840961 RepID=A0A9D1IVQ6_9CLOT|nr:Na/Pi cotransporter family protein [Candidatus Ventrousia excrementavium]